MRKALLKQFSWQKLEHKLVIWSKKTKTTHIYIRVRMRTSSYKLLAHSIFKFFPVHLWYFPFAWLSSQLQFCHCHPYWSSFPNRYPSSLKPSDSSPFRLIFNCNYSTLKKKNHAFTHVYMPFVTQYNYFAHKHYFLFLLMHAKISEIKSYWWKFQENVFKTFHFSEKL